MSDPGFLGLVRQHVRSVWTLELLLLMRSQPDRLWRAEELVRELRASAALVADSLGRLQASGLVTSLHETFGFGPRTPELARFCDQLEEFYRTSPVALINLIASESRVQGLADAFKFKGDPK